MIRPNSKKKIDRPSIVVQGGSVNVRQSGKWASKLSASKDYIQRAITSVGRIQVCKTDECSISHLNVLVIAIR